MTDSTQQRWRDELDDIHSQLLTAVRQQEDYIDGRISAIWAYSEGAEHALSIVRLRLHEMLREAKESAWNEGAERVFMDGADFSYASNPYTQQAAGAAKIARQWTGAEWLTVVNHPWDVDKVPPHDPADTPHPGDIRAFKAGSFGEVRP